MSVRVYGVSGSLGRPDLAVRGCELPGTGAGRLWESKIHYLKAEPFSSPFVLALKSTYSRSREVTPIPTAVNRVREKLNLVVFLPFQ